MTAGPRGSFSVPVPVPPTRTHLPPPRSRPPPAASRARSHQGLRGEARRPALTSPRAGAAAAAAGPWWAEACGCACRRARGRWGWVGAMPLVSMERGQAPRLRRPVCRAQAAPSKGACPHTSAASQGPALRCPHLPSSGSMRKAPSPSAVRAGGPAVTRTCAPGAVCGAGRAGAPRDGRKIKGTKEEKENAAANK